MRLEKGDLNADVEVKRQKLVELLKEDVPRKLRDEVEAKVYGPKWRYVLEQAM